MTVSWLDISSTSPRVGYIATDAQTEFVVPFAFFSDADLEVYVNDVLQTLSTDYTVAGAEDPDGGTLTFGAGLTVGDDVLIARIIQIEQTSHFPLSGPLDIPSLNLQLSRLIAIAQQLEDQIGLALRVAESDTTPLRLPPATERANRGLLFDASGNPIAGETPASGVISAPMAPVVGAASLALGRTAFGLGYGAGLQSDGGDNIRATFPVSAVSIDTAIQAAAHLTFFDATGPITFTIDAAAALWSGFGFFVNAHGGAVKLAFDAGDNAIGVAANTPIYVPAGQQVYVTTNGTAGWVILWGAGVGPYDVRRFGAVCDGTTDDSAAVQAAITAAGAVNGEVVVPGWCKITVQLDVTKKLTIRGIGPYLSGFTSDVAALIIMKINIEGTPGEGPADQSTACVVRDMGFVYTVLVSTGGANAAIYVTEPIGNWINLYTQFINLQFKNCNYGVYTIRAGTWKMDRCDFYNCQKGVHVENEGFPDSGSSSITNCVMTMADAVGIYGIEMYSGGGLYVTNNKFNGGQVTFFLNLSAGALTGDLTFANNLCEGGPQLVSAILLQRQANTATFQIVVISGNELNGTFPVHIPLDASGIWITGITITGNIILGGTPGGGLVTINSARGLAFSDNVMWPLGGATVKRTVIDASVDYAVVGPNVATDVIGASTVSSTNTTTIAPY